MKNSYTHDLSQIYALITQLPGLMIGIRAASNDPR
jgi:hypothetical protein